MTHLKVLYIISAIYFSLITSTFSQEVLSLNALFTEQDAILVPEIEGSWKLPVFDMGFNFTKVGDNFYHLKLQDENVLSVYEAIIVNIEDHFFLDLKGFLPDTLFEDDFRDSFLPGHSIYKLQMKADSLFISSFNYAWFYKYAHEKKCPFRYEWIRNDMLLTLSTEELKSFLADHLHEENIFNAPDTLFIEQSRDAKKDEPSPVMQTNDRKVMYQHKCKPAFPFQDGWLGGDGDISVPLNDSTVLFLFSDTYVGYINQKNRQEAGMQMISNSIALQACLSNGENNVRYYWKNMHTNHPRPIFQSYTERYRFWVVDAFMLKNNLYVVLTKVGPQAGSPPDNIFNFSLLGFTLARIANPMEPPPKWKIELTPLRDFTNDYMDIRCHTIWEDYLYFFVNRNDNAQILLRKHMDEIDHPDKPFAYYARDKTWKTGFKESDMDTVVHGFRSNTVNYHPDLNQWIMISDIWFMDNKIKMRTSPDLTGPWSDEIVIYEIPEMTPGNSLYNSTNFCYLAREHIQYYDPQSHMMLLTYDINNSDYSELRSNPNIYKPKVITIPLK